MVHVDIQSGFVSLARAVKVGGCVGGSGTAFIKKVDVQSFGRRGRIAAVTEIVAVTFRNEVERIFNPPRVKPLPDKFCGRGELRIGFAAELDS